MTNPLGDLISRGEGGYNSYNRGTQHGRIVPGNQKLDFSVMTLEELTRRQGLPSGNPEKVFAVGKYQVIPPTMSGAISQLHLDPTAKYSPEVQERIFSEYLIRSKRPAIYNYIVDGLGVSLHAAQKAASQEWASIDDPDTPGKPYGEYAKHGNRSSIRAAQVAKALDSMRDSYRLNLAKGMSPNEAWRTVTGQVALANAHEGRADPIAHTNDTPSEDKPPQMARHEPLSRQGHANPQVRQLQANLRHLGYQDANGHALVADGIFGSNTNYAVTSFQRAHHLHVDGIVGKQTLAALEDAKRWPLLSEAAHPQHRLYAQIEQGIRTLPHHAHGSEREVGNSAVALTIAAHASGLQRVDHVVLGTNGVNLFAVQGRMNDPAHRRVHVELSQAMAAHAVDHRAVSTPQPAPAHALAAAQQPTSGRPMMMGP